MKKLISLFISLAFAGSSFAQMSGYSTSQSNGTTLGANETLTANGIALGNAVKLRGYINTALYRNDAGSGTNAYDGTWLNGDMDFLVDLSPVTAEVHLTAGDSTADSVGLEQAFGRYSFNQDFHLTFGRQMTVLGFDSDEFTNRYAVTAAYGLNSRKASVDGFRVNYNNGMFGLILGIHDNYGLNDPTEIDGGMAVDLAASVMFFPGLEARLGIANENGSTNDDTTQVNGWIAWNPSDLTLAFEFDTIDNDDGSDSWDIMLLANYQFSDFFGATLRYSHIDVEVGGLNADTDRVTLALLFDLTENFALNFEYSHAEVDISSSQSSVDELYLQALLSY
jgi:hypothetical protein